MRVLSIVAVGGNVGLLHHPDHASMAAYHSQHSNERLESELFGEGNEQIRRASADAIGRNESLSRRIRFFSLSLTSILVHFDHAIFVLVTYFF
jgi:hypothetical protein